VITIEVLVKLAAPDPWSFTLLDTLRCRFACQSVVGVRRIKAWELTFTADREDEALDTTRGLLNETALLANPNRDVWVIRGSGQPVAEDFWHTAAGGGSAFVVKVCDKEDMLGSSIQRIVGSRLGITTIKRVRFATIWVLEIGSVEANPIGLVNDIAVARSWRKGLLANPHCQTSELAAAAEYFRTEAR
jgi:phosphoribosylformylglycinamidine (FGAM) synthase PurS component